MNILKTLAASALIFSCVSSIASDNAGLVTTPTAVWKIEHGPQGTGNYKRLKDRHEKPKPNHEKKKKKNGWIDLKKRKR